MQKDMRDRMIELIQNAVGGCARHWAEIIADYLLSNGVIVPSCKVGDTVYSFIQGIPVIYEGRVYEIIYNGHVCIYRGTRKGYFTQAFSEDDIGKTVFLTREEAEQALKEKE